MAFDFDTPGAIFLFLVLVGLLNAVFKLARNRFAAVALFAIATGSFGIAHWPLSQLDPYSPGLMFGAFVALSALLNLFLVLSGRSLALNRSELVLVYVMLLVVSALCTMGMSQQLLPAITALVYYASPGNKWTEKQKKKRNKEEEKMQPAPCCCCSSFLQLSG